MTSESTSSDQSVARWVIGLYSDTADVRDGRSSTDSFWLGTTSKTTSHLPFAAMSINRIVDLKLIECQADVGCYLVAERTMRNVGLKDLGEENLPGIVGIHAMIPSLSLGSRDSDHYWRDTHAPLALKVHDVMTHYYQLSVREVLRGPDYSGFGLCCCATDKDLRLRFFDSEEGRRAILKDVIAFSDTKRSPRRVVANFVSVGA